MTLASSIIADAYRETNLVPIVGASTTLEKAEALARLNNIVLSTIGNEVGDKLTDLNYGGTYDESIIVKEFVPVNCRLVLNLSAATTLKLHPAPVDGQRVAIIDNSANLATRNLTLNANGRRIETGATAVLNTNSLNRQWLYRADTGNWVRVAPLLSTDEMPLPQEFDDYFIIALAMRLTPRNSREIDGISMETFKRMRSQLRARYNNPRQVKSDLDPRTAGMTGRYFLDNESDGATPWL